MSPLHITVNSRDDVVEITLVGELRADTNPQFDHELKKIATSKPRRLVLHLHGLTFLASIGVRALLVIKRDEMGVYTDVYLIAPQPHVMAVIERCSLPTSFIIQDSYHPVD
jgi:anti-anti-sigma factor